MQGSDRFRAESALGSCGNDPSVPIRAEPKTAAVPQLLECSCHSGAAASQVAIAL